MAEILLREMARRGPDGGWWEQCGPSVLVQTRLAVIDLSDRVQYPMPNEDGSLRLLFNGEIYNHLDLRRDLVARGHTFATECDAEVLVHGYEEWGTDVFGRLNGMWAAALVDSRTGQVVLGRDRLGIKPLVRTTSGRFAFASDAMALVAAGLSSGKIDSAAIAEYAAFHYVPPPGTGIVGIEQVEPGTYVRRARDGSEVVHRWAQHPFTDRPPSRVVSVDEADDALRRAVARQLVADVPVGVFLSGGLDSSLLLSYAVELGARPTALTIGFAGHGDYDEATRAAALCRDLGVPHEFAPLDIDFNDAVRRLAAAYDAPFADSSAIATMALSELAHRHVTVALSGTGGDDLFAGYYRHRVHHLRAVVRRIPMPLLRMAGVFEPPRGTERSSGLMLARSYAARIGRAATTEPSAQYLSLIASCTSRAGLEALPGLDFASASQRVAARHRLRGGDGDWLSAMQDFELRTYLPGDLLVKEDRAAMAYSVEGRVPLLDDEVVDLAVRTTPNQRATLRAGKRLLREVGLRRLPGRRGQGRKRGFAVPLGDLLQGRWREEAHSWIEAQQSNYVDTRRAADLLGDPRVPPSDVWALIALCAWEERFRGAARPG